jgi:hypothetical protein
MIRFVDLRRWYYLEDDGPPVCAFIDTITDTFICGSGGPIFSEESDLPEVRSTGDHADRMRRLVPDGFWAAVPAPKETEAERALDHFLSGAPMKDFEG